MIKPGKHEKAPKWRWGFFTRAPLFGYEGTPCGRSASEGRRYRCPAIANPGTLKLANRSQPETEAQIAISPFRAISIPEVIL